ncbi:signal peptidase I [Sphingomonas mesophila]|uniref:signal peptidase I n=1 Tax=Sphingomonas mesophila TaxID=2303576 RepID=UPI001F07AC66|nr:signal peptidase I [Sphingomonas mesophila]
MRGPRTPNTRSTLPAWFSTLRFFALLAFAAWALRSLVAAPFSIPSGSMMPTMLPGDYLFVAKWPYGFSRFSFPAQLPSFPGRILARLPERGDVVIFKRPGEGTDWVKRVIGLPGDTVELRSGMLILNRRPVPRSATAEIRLPRTPNTDCAIDGSPDCRYPAFVETLPNGRRYVTLDQLERGPADDFGPIAVPAGHLFLLGDNRDDSADSRFALADGGIGLVPVDHLVGRAAFAFWSTDGSAEAGKPWTWFKGLRRERLGQGYQP